MHNALAYLREYFLVIQKSTSRIIKAEPDTAQMMPNKIIPMSIFWGCGRGGWGCGWGSTFGGVVLTGYRMLSDLRKYNSV